MHKFRPVFDVRVGAAVLILSMGTLAGGAQAFEETHPSLAAAPAEAAAGAGETASSAHMALSAFDAATWDDISIGRIDRKVFELALASAQNAVERGKADPSTLTVIDFSKPSTTARMWVYDLRSRELLFEEHVAHGRNSGFDVPTSFSNQAESNKSSLGLYRAAEAYIGKHGYSLRLDGLEPGFNDHARDRAIVIHGAEYVNADTAKTQGRLGRSLGCPAVRPEISRRLIDAVKDGGLVFAYYPDAGWLGASPYLN